MGVAGKEVTETIPHGLLDEAVVVIIAIASWMGVVNVSRALRTWG